MIDKRDNIILENISVSEKKVFFSFTATGNVRKYFTTNMLFIEYDIDVSQIPLSILTIPFIATILPLAWLTDTRLWVTEVDQTFYDSIPKLKYAYQEMYPNVNLRGQFISAKVIKNFYDITHEALLLFSGGLDAHTSYIRIKEMKPALCNIQGWFQRLNEVNIAAEADYRDIMQFAGIEKVPFFYVKSNFAVLINSIYFRKTLGKKLKESWWHGFNHSMSFISIVIPLAYVGGYRNIYIASSFTIGMPLTCASFATTDIEFRFASEGGCIHDAFELTRQNKVRILVENKNKTKTPYPIRVCSFNSINCCKCEKCFRTIAALVAEGSDPKDFGFYIDEPLKLHFQSSFSENIHQFNVEGENLKYWPSIKTQMRQNYEQVFDKDFVDWFLTYDFVTERKKAIRRYYRRDFFTILKRKLGL